MSEWWEELRDLKDGLYNILMMSVKCIKKLLKQLILKSLIPENVLAHRAKIFCN